MHGVDLSRWQVGLKISDLPASCAFVNISLSKGLNPPENVGQARQTWVSDARKAGKTLLGYHWLNATASGAEQWKACRREALAVFGSLDGWGLELDCEDTGSPPTYQHVADFMAAAKADLKRPVAFYSGDWWLEARSWPNLADLTPYLWSASNAGWLTAVPGELSAHWRWTGKGGWSHLSLLQWSDTEKYAGIKVSKTVVRNPEVLCALTGRHVDVL